MPRLPRKVPPPEPRLPRKTKVDVSKCHACQMKRRWMLPSATPVPRLPRKVLRRHRRPIPAQAHAHHQSQPSAISATPATRNASRCHQAPRLPRETTVNVDKCNAGRPIPAETRHQSQPSAISATPATQNEGRCLQVPHLPRETEVDVTKCHACHVKRR